jgi:NTP pyrophosphatase (non-canonical NTP hydrolase)
MKQYKWTEQWDEEYKKIIKDVSIYPKGEFSNNGCLIDMSDIYLIPAIAGEVGELTGWYSKIIRDKNGYMDDDDIEDMLSELGDILFMVSSLATLYGSSLKNIAAMNAEKLISRKKRNVLGGSGDKR